MEKLCKLCHRCQGVAIHGPVELMAQVSPPSALWQDCNTDFMGMLFFGKGFLVVVKYYNSRFCCCSQESDHH